MAGIAIRPSPMDQNTGFTEPDAAKVLQKHRMEPRNTRDKIYGLTGILSEDASRQTKKIAMQHNPRKEKLKEIKTKTKEQIHQGVPAMSLHRKPSLDEVKHPDHEQGCTGLN